MKLTMNNNSDCPVVYRAWKIQECAE